MPHVQRTRREGVEHTRLHEVNMKEGLVCETLEIPNSIEPNWVEANRCVKACSDEGLIMALSVAFDYPDLKFYETKHRKYLGRAAEGIRELMYRILEDLQSAWEMKTGRSPYNRTQLAASSVLGAVGWAYDGNHVFEGGDHKEVASIQLLKLCGVAHAAGFIGCPNVVDSIKVTYDPINATASVTINQGDYDRCVTVNDEGIIIDDIVDGVVEDSSSWMHVDVPPFLSEEEGPPENEEPPEACVKPNSGDIEYVDAEVDGLLPTSPSTEDSIPPGSSIHGFSDEDDDPFSESSSG